MWDLNDIFSILYNNINKHITLSQNEEELEQMSKTST